MHQKKPWEWMEKNKQTASPVQAANGICHPHFSDEQTEDRGHQETCRGSQQVCASRGSDLLQSVPLGLQSVCGEWGLPHALVPPLVIYVDGGCNSGRAVARLAVSPNEEISRQVPFPPYPTRLRGPPPPFSSLPSYPNPPGTRQPPPSASRGLGAESEWCSLRPGLGMGGSQGLLPGAATAPKSAPKSPLAVYRSQPALTHLGR